MSRSHEGSSILARIEARGRATPRVRLRELPEEAAVRLEKIVRRQTGRYEVHGRIARGGVGEVLRGRDVDLGRDVAMKVLRSEHRGNADLVRRFVEEAQIGGQLQHPGIVPVYELGLESDKRPFFTMRLVKGRTLAALLDARAETSAERRRFLTIFAQICQTVAYAHSRGVVHRDLKPSNVMVGSFGEVQVIDWGFAKVLEQGGVADERRAKQAEVERTRIATLRSQEGSHSLTGSVIGTPAYMPPEQAIGDVDKLDERSDVFTLGGMLCEVLTGRPTYVGDDLLVLAAQGRTEDACDALDRCGGDPALVALAKACLAPLRRDRPRHAGVLSERIARHVMEVEDRVQKSRLVALEARRSAAHAKAGAARARAAAEAANVRIEREQARADRARRYAARARAEAEEARRARGQLFKLAAAVLLVALVGGGTFGLLANRRRQRAADASARVHAALEEARAHRAEERWTQALLAARRGRDFATDATRAEVDATLADIASAKSEADARSTRRAKELAFVARLERIRMERADDYDAIRTHKAFRDAFRAYGIDTERLTPTAVAARIRDLPEFERVVEALHEWAWIAGTYWVKLRGGNRERVVAILDAMDGDPLRKRLRTAHFAQNLAELKRIAAEIRRTWPSAMAARFAGIGLAEAGDAAAARALLHAAWRKFPGDVFLSLRLAHEYGSLGHDRAAVRYLEAALAARPGSAHTIVWLARAHAGAGNPALADAWFARALETHPRYAIAHAEIAKRHLASDPPLAQRHYETALRLAGPEADAIHNIIGVHYAALNETEQARACFERAVAMRPDHPRYRANLANMHSRLLEYEAAAAQYRALLQRWPDFYAGWTGLGAILTSDLRYDEAAAAERKAIALDGRNPSGYNNLAVTLLRAGKLNEALAVIRKAAELSPGSSLVAANRGRIWFEQGLLGEAYQHYYEALGRQRSSTLLAQIGYVLYTNGEMEQAELAYREAVAAQPENGRAHYNLAATLFRRGDWDGARRGWERAAEFPAWKQHACAALSGLAAVRGDAATAFRLAVESNASKPWTTGLRAKAAAQYQAGDPDAAVATLREALGLAIERRESVAMADYDDVPGCQYDLAWHVWNRGEFEEAQQLFAQADDLSRGRVAWAAPTYRHKEDAARMLALRDRLDGVLAGGDRPAAPDELALFARMAYLTRHAAAAVRLFEEAFAREPTLRDDREGLALTYAAHAAARAGFAANDPELRGKAIAWLREDLYRRAEELRVDDRKRRMWNRNVLLNLFREPDFAPGRDPELLRKLPPDERDDWRAYWIEIRWVLARPDGS